MHRPPDKVNTSEAIASIRKYAHDGVEILGVEGFVVVPEGFIAALDLILDVSERNLTLAQVAAEAEAFVNSRARPDVLWEVWTEVG